MGSKSAEALTSVEGALLCFLLPLLGKSFITLFECIVHESGITLDGVCKGAAVLEMQGSQATYGFNGLCLDYLFVAKRTGKNSHPSLIVFSSTEGHSNWCAPSGDGLHDIQDIKRLMCHLNFKLDILKRLVDEINAHIVAGCKARGF